MLLFLLKNLNLLIFNKKNYFDLYLFLCSHLFLNPSSLLSLLIIYTSSWVFCVCLFSNICKCAQLGERAHLCVVCQLSVCDSVVSLCLNPVVKGLSGSKLQGLIILTKHTQAHSHNRQRTICHLSVRHKTFCP